MFKKKGIKLSLWVFVDIIFISVLILAVFPFINDVKESTYFEKRFFSKDMALVMGTMQSLPGDVLYSYSHEKLGMSDYDFRFTKNKVAVSESDKNTGGSNFVSYPFYNNQFLLNDYKGNIKNPSTIHFSKTMDVMKVDTESSGISNRDCPKIKSAVISEKGKVFILHKESKQEAEKISTFIDNSLVYDSAGVQSSLEVPVILTIDARASDENSIKVYYMNKAKETFSLGCHVRNKIAETGEFASVRLLPGLERQPSISDDFLALYFEVHYMDKQSIEYLGLGIKKGIIEYDKNVQ